MNARMSAVHNLLAHLIPCSGLLLRDGLHFTPYGTDQFSGCGKYGIAD
jgi:hypothetical protein